MTAARNKFTALGRSTASAVLLVCLMHVFNFVLLALLIKLSLVCSIAARKPEVVLTSGLSQIEGPFHFQILIFTARRSVASKAGIVIAHGTGGRVGGRKQKCAA